jgi:tetratricopeptide (TPR) repeat protein
MPTPCPVCGQEATGRFCSNCGTNLEAPAGCTECGNQLPEGARYCNRCGAPTPVTRAALAEAPAARSDPAAARIIGVTVVLAAVVGLAVWYAGRDDGAPAAPIATAPPAAGAGGGPGAIDLSTMTPREAADRLFERVVRLAEAGDTSQARGFLPMALAAYGQLPPREIDADARYHLAVLHLIGDEPQRARAQADTILASEPTHLFGLYNAGRAEQEMGNPEEARRFFQTLLEVYDREVALPRPEYEAHAQVLPIMRQEASRAVDSP